MLPNMISRKQRPFQEADTIRGHPGRQLFRRRGKHQVLEGQRRQKHGFERHLECYTADRLVIERGVYRQEADRDTKSRDGGVEQECPECPRPADAIIISYIHQPEE